MHLTFLQACPVKVVAAYALMNSFINEIIMAWVYNRWDDTHATMRGITSITITATLSGILLGSRRLSGRCNPFLKQGKWLIFASLLNASHFKNLWIQMGGFQFHVNLINCLLIYLKFTGSSLASKHSYILGELWVGIRNWYP